MDRTEYMRKYRLENKEKCKEYRKKWRQLHKDDVIVKEKNKNYAKLYYQRKKQEKDEKV